MIFGKSKNENSQFSSAAVAVQRAFKSSIGTEITNVYGGCIGKIFYGFLQIRCLRAEYVFEGSSYSKIFKTLCFKACLIRPLLFLLLRSTFIFNFEMAFSEMHLIKYVLVVDLQLCLSDPRAEKL